MPKCDKCGNRIAMHREFRSGEDRSLCCQCYVQEGNAPADWHPECIMGEEAIEIERLRSIVDRANVVLREYEDSGFSDPGRHIDAVRDALGRRYPQ